MSNTFTKTSLRGFTLIELLVVIAIIGLLSTAIMGPVQTGLKKGRDTRKISDVTQIQGALLQYAGDNAGLYPSLMTGLTPNYMATDTNMLTGAVLRNKFMYVTYSDTAANIVMYHLGVALENQNASLQSDVDCGDTVTGLVIDETVNLIGAAPSSLVNLPCTAGLDGGTLANSNWSLNSPGNPKAGSALADFGGHGTAEAANGICIADLGSCIFDIIPK